MTSGPDRRPAQNEQLGHACLVTVQGTGDDGRASRPLRRLLIYAIGVGFLAGLTGLMVLAAVNGTPLRALGCLVDGRDGWIVELPSDARTAQDVRQAVRAQTECVPVDVGYVNWNLVPEGSLAFPVDASRTWVPGGGAIKVWVEGSPEDATDACAPMGPRTAPPAGCPGGPQVAR